MNYSTVIEITQGDDGWRHLWARCMWPTAEECQQQMELVMHTFADGKTAHIRMKPWSKHVVDFETKEPVNTGGVRLSFKNEPGEWKYPLDEHSNVMFGLATLEVATDA